jgi:hypothetical protein
VIVALTVVIVAMNVAMNVTMSMAGGVIVVAAAV